jgi:hypothetical protein
MVWNRGKSWEEIRRFSLRTLREFGFGRSQSSFESVLLEEVQGFLESVRENSTPTHNGLLWTLDTRLLSASTLNMIWRYVGGYTRIPQQDEGLDIGNTTTKALGIGNMYNIFPWLAKWFPKWSGYEEHCQVFRKHQELIKVSWMWPLEIIRKNSSSWKFRLEHG